MKSRFRSNLVVPAVCYKEPYISGRQPYNEQETIEALCTRLCLLGNLWDELSQEFKQAYEDEKGWVSSGTMSLTMHFIVHCVVPALHACQRGYL